jgi:hypothetical protein
MPSSIEGVGPDPAERFLSPRSRVSRKFIDHRALLDGAAMVCGHDERAVSTRSVGGLLRLQHGLNRRTRPRAERFDLDIDSAAANGLVGSQLALAALASLAAGERRSHAASSSATPTGQPDRDSPDGLDR